MREEHQKPAAECLLSQSIYPPVREGMGGGGWIPPQRDLRELPS